MNHIPDRLRNYLETYHNYISLRSSIWVAWYNTDKPQHISRINHERRTWAAEQLYGLW